MKYLCKEKNSVESVGLGDTFEKAFDDLNDSGFRGGIKDVEWFTLHPIKVKLVIDTSTNKGIKK